MCICPNSAYILGIALLITKKSFKDIIFREYEEVRYGCEN